MRSIENELRLERHRGFKDVVEIKFAENDEPDNPHHNTKMHLRPALNRFRHPFAFDEPSMDVTLLGSAVEEHLNEANNAS